MSPQIITPAFLVSSLLVIMTPGPDLALITHLVLVGRRLRTAFTAALGMVCAACVHVAVGATGLAVLLMARPTLFTAFRWAGAILLLGMGAFALRSALRGADQVAEADHHPRVRFAFLRGLLCTGTNPKVGLFLLAFLPQFVPAGVAPTTAMPVLAAVYLGLVLLWLVLWMTLVGRLARFVHTCRVTRIAEATTAAVLAFFAVQLFLGG